MEGVCSLEPRARLPSLFGRGHALALGVALLAGAEVIVRSL
jgi:hypothetical protein